MEAILDTTPIETAGLWWVVDQRPDIIVSLRAACGDLCVIVARDRVSMVMSVRYTRDTMSCSEFLPEEWTALESVASTLRTRLVLGRIR